MENLKTRPQRSTLRFRLTILVVLLVLAATVIVTFVSLMLAERGMKTVIGAQQYSSLTGAVAYIDEHLQAKRTLLDALAQALPPEAQSGRQALHRFLTAQTAARQQFSTMAVFDREGVPVDMLYAGTLPRPPNVRERQYFIDTMATRRGLISAPFKSMTSGQPVVAITAPVLDRRGEVVLVLVGVINLLESSLLEPLAGLRPGQTGHMFIMTRDGVLISHPDQSLILQRIGARQSAGAATGLALGGFEGWTEARNDLGSAGIYSYKRLRTTGWVVATRFPTAEALAPLIGQRRAASVAAALFALAAGSVAWIGVRRLFSPLERLRRQLADILAGRAGIGVLQAPRNGGEIGELGEAFHKAMAGREEAQAATRASELRVRTILERAPDAFVSCDIGGHVVEWNAQAEGMFGWSRAEAAGRDLAELIIPERLRAAHHAGLRRFAGSGTGPVVNSRIRVPALHRDGREIPVELSVAAVPCEGGYLATAFIHDVSERIAFEEQIAAREKHIRTIADNLPALIAYLNPQARFEFSNSHYQRVWGVDPAAMIGKSVTEVFGAQAQSWAPEIERALGGARLHYERDTLAGGRTIILMVDLIPDLAADGSVRGIYLMAMDITERKHAELRQAASERKAEAASRAKSEFVANMSHEIRTPMNGILGLVQLLGNTAVSSLQRKYLDLIHNSGNALLAILNDILDFSKIEAGRMELAPEPFHIKDVLNAIAAVMTLEAGAKDLELAIGIEPDVPQLLQGDAMRLQQILTNLVSNAVKFTERGEVSLLVGLGERAGAVATLRFSVRDSGIGIDPAQQARLFSAFTQADASTTRRFGGTGLGLAICRRLAELMGGRIEVRSELGGGSEFTLEVPLTVLPDDAAGAAAAAPDGAAARSLEGVRLLLVEDNALNQLVACSMLEFAGARVATVGNGQEAVELLREGAGRFDAVLMDVQMPVMDGIEATRIIRAELKAALPILAMTAGVMETERERCLQAGMDDFIAKPIDVEQMLEQIRRHVRGGAAAKS